MAIIRPTDVYNVSLVNPAYCYDSNSITAATVETPAAAVVASIGGSAALEATNSWGAGDYGNLGAATLNVTMARGSSSNDTAWVEYGYMSGGTFTRVGYIYGPAVGNALAKTTLTASLSPTDFGTLFANLANLRVRIGGTKVAGSDYTTLSIYEVWLDVAEFNLTGNISTTTPKITGSFTPGRFLVGSVPSLTVAMAATQENVPVPASRLEVIVPATGMSVDTTNFPLKVQISSKAGSNLLDVTSVMASMLLATPQQIHAYQGETSLNIDLVLWDQDNARAIMYVLVPTLYAAQETKITVVFDESMPTNPLLSTSWAAGNPTDLVWGGDTSSFVMSGDAGILATNGYKTLSDRANGANTSCHIHSHTGGVTWNDKTGHSINVTSTYPIDTPFPAGGEDWEIGICVKLPISATYTTFYYSVTTGQVYVRLTRTSAERYTWTIYSYNSGQYLTGTSAFLHEVDGGWISFVVCSQYVAGTNASCRGYLYDSENTTLYGPTYSTIACSAPAFPLIPALLSSAQTVAVAGMWFNNAASGITADDIILRRLRARNALDVLAVVRSYLSRGLDVYLPGIKMTGNSGIWDKNQYIKIDWDHTWYTGTETSIDYMCHRVILSKNAGRDNVDVTDIFRRIGDDPRHVRISTSPTPSYGGIDVYTDITYWDVEKEFAIIYFRDNIQNTISLLVDKSFYIHYDQDRINPSGKQRTCKDTFVYPDSIKSQVYPYMGGNVYQFTDEPPEGQWVPSIRCLRTGHQPLLEGGNALMLQFDEKIGPYWRFNGINQSIKTIGSYDQLARDGICMGVRDVDGTKERNFLLHFNSPDYYNTHWVLYGVENDPDFGGNDFVSQHAYRYLYLDYEGINSCAVPDIRNWDFYTIHNTTVTTTEARFHHSEGMSVIYDQPSTSTYVDTTQVLMRDSWGTAYGAWDIFFFATGVFYAHPAVGPELFNNWGMDNFWNVRPPTCDSGRIAISIAPIVMEVVAHSEMLEVPVSGELFMAPMTAEMYAASYVSAEIPAPMTSSMTPGLGMVGTMPKLRIVIYEGTPAHGNMLASIHPPSICEMYGHHVLAALDVRLKPIACRAYSGASMGTRIPRLRISDFTGENGVTADIGGALTVLQAEMYVGSRMAMVLPGISSYMSAGNEILGQLQVDIPGMVFAGYGDSDVAIALISRLRAISCRMTASGKRPYGLDVTIPALRSELRGHPGIVAHLEAQLGEIWGTGRGSERINLLEVEISPFYMRMETISECCSEVLRHTRGAVR